MIIKKNKPILVKKTLKCDIRTLPEGTVITEDDAKDDTLLHIQAVQNCGDFLCDLLKKQFKNHDHTKLEGKHLKEFTDGLNKGFDSPEFDEWYDMHVKSERHHLLNRVPDDVNLIDVLEMLCDSCSAGMARTGKVFDVEVPEDILTKAVKNTVDLLLKNMKVED